MEAYEAVVTITHKGESGTLPDPVNYQATSEEVLQWITEAVRNGDVPGIAADPTAVFQDYMVDRYDGKPNLPETDTAHWNRLNVRPKTPLG